MTQVQADPAGQGQVLDGTIAGRFIYTSEGSEGWRVSSSVGRLPDEVQEEAIGFVQRLTSPPGFAVPEPADRNRRLGWVGATKSQWRFLMNSIAAGSDASNRPNNCVNDCLVVRRDSRVAGADPASFWDSPDWSTPYGAQEVSMLDLRRDASALHPKPSQAVDVSQLAAFIQEGGRPPGYLLGLAALIERIATGARSSWVGTRDDVDAMGPILLSSLYRMLPIDIGWEVTSEIWRVTDGQVPATGADVALRLADSDRLPPSLQPLQISDTTNWQPPSPVLCPECGKRLWSWSDVLIAALSRLAVHMRSGAATPEIKRLSGLLSDYCQSLREQGVTSEHFVQRFTAEALPAPYHDLISLVGEVVTHEHIRVVMYESDPVAGTQRLRYEPPSDITHLEALWFRYPKGPPEGMAAVPGARAMASWMPDPQTQMQGPDQAVLGMHLALGDGPEQAYAWLQSWSAFARSDDSVAFTGQDTRRKVANRVLRSVAVVATAHYGKRSPLSLSTEMIMWCLDIVVEGDDWSEPIASVDLLDHFLQSWTDHDPASAVSSLLKQPVRRGDVTYPVGYWMAVEALKPQDAELAGQFLGIIDKRHGLGSFGSLVPVLKDLSEHVRQSARGGSRG